MKLPGIHQIGGFWSPRRKVLAERCQCPGPSPTPPCQPGNAQPEAERTFLHARVKRLRLLRLRSADVMRSGEKPSRQSRQHVQRPWGWTGPGVGSSGRPVWLEGGEKGRWWECSWEGHTVWGLGSPSRGDGKLLEGL